MSTVFTERVMKNVDVMHESKQLNILFEGLDEKIVNAIKILPDNINNFKADKSGVSKLYSLADKVKNIKESEVLQKIKKVIPDFDKNLIASKQNIQKRFAVLPNDVKQRFSNMLALVPKDKQKKLLDDTAKRIPTGFEAGSNLEILIWGGLLFKSILLFLKSAHTLSLISVPLASVHAAAFAPIVVASIFLLISLAMLYNHIKKRKEASEEY